MHAVLAAMAFAQGDLADRPGPLGGRRRARRPDRGRGRPHAQRRRDRARRAGRGRPRRGDAARSRPRSRCARRSAPRASGCGRSPTSGSGRSCCSRATPLGAVDRGRSRAGRPPASGGTRSPSTSRGSPPRRSRWSRVPPTRAQPARRGRPAQPRHRRRRQPRLLPRQPRRGGVASPPTTTGRSCSTVRRPGCARRSGPTSTATTSPTRRCSPSALDRARLALGESAAAEAVAEGHALAASTEATVGLALTAR